MSNVVGLNGGNASQDPLQPLGKSLGDKADYMEPEQKLWSGGYSPKAMFGTWLLTILLTVAILVGCYFLRAQVEYVWWIGGAIILVCWIYVLMAYAYRRLGYSYELTNMRLIHQRGIVVRTTDRIDVIEIDDVMFTQGLVERMLNVGTIKLSSSDKSHPVLWLKGIDRVKETSNLIDDTRLRQRRRRSVVAIAQT